MDQQTGKPTYGKRGSAIDGCSAASYVGRRQGRSSLRGGGDANWDAAHGDCRVHGGSGSKGSSAGASDDASRVRDTGRQASSSSLTLLQMGIDNPGRRISKAGLEVGQVDLVHGALCMGNVEADAFVGVGRDEGEGGQCCSCCSERGDAARLDHGWGGCCVCCLMDPSLGACARWVKRETTGEVWCEVCVSSLCV